MTIYKYQDSYIILENVSTISLNNSEDWHIKYYYLNINGFEVGQPQLQENIIEEVKKLAKAIQELKLHDS